MLDTGILRLLEMDEGLIFDDIRCPKCGGYIDVIEYMTNSHKIKVRYECIDCHYKCPIQTDIETEEITPVYDRSVKDFINNFGDK